MRSRALIGLAVVTLCAWVTAGAWAAQSSADEAQIVSAGEPAGTVSAAAQDPNTPWDPTKHLTATWQYVYLETVTFLYNPAVMGNMTPSGPSWYFMLDGRVAVVDSNGLLGLSSSAVSARAMDAAGHVILTVPASTNPYRSYQPLRSTSAYSVGANGMLTTTQILGSSFFVDFPMTAGTRLPSTFGRIEWSSYVLLAKETKTVDIPFAVSDTWIELAPGLEILVEKALAEEEEYQFSIKVRWQSAQADYTSRGSLYLSGAMKPPASMVMSMQVLDNKGKLIPGGTEGGSYTSMQGVMIGNHVGSGYGPTCGDATTIRYTLARDAYEQAVQFAVENVPVPASR
jgi:hypothetical protein